MDIRVGDKVRVPIKTRDKWSLPHLTGEYVVQWVKGDYITFFTGERINQQSVRCKKGQRCWHKMHLVEVCGIEENE